VDAEGQDIVIYMSHYFSKSGSYYKVEIETKKIENPCNEVEEFDYLRIFNGSSNERLVRSLLKETKIGPDEIYVQVEGMSMQTLVALRDSSCSPYYAIVQIPRAGKHRLKVFRARKNFLALSQEKREFPSITYEIFYDEFIELPLIQTMYPCTKSFPGGAISCRYGFWVSNITNPFMWPPLRLLPDRGLPLSTMIKVNFQMVIRL